MPLFEKWNCAPPLLELVPTSSRTGALAPVAFLAGHWIRSQPNLHQEESWLAPRGDTMLGVARTVKSGKTVHHEYLRLEVGPEGTIENADVTIEDDILTVSGYRDENCPHHKCTFYQMEISYGTFAKVVFLRMDYDRDGISASLRDGYLNLTIPRASEPRSERIAVEIRL